MDVARNAVSLVLVGYAIKLHGRNKAAARLHSDHSEARAMCRRKVVGYLEDVLQPQRQRCQVQQVRHSQVNQINAKLILLLQLHGCVV